MTNLDICISNDWLDWAYGFSPVSLTQLELFNGFAPKMGNQSGICGEIFHNCNRKPQCIMCDRKL